MASLPPRLARPLAAETCVDRIAALLGMEESNDLDAALCRRRAARLVAYEPPAPDPVCKESLHTAGDAG